MTVYRVQVRGSGFMLEMDAGPPEPHGFYVVHWVTASSMEEARGRAIQLVRASPKVVGQSSLRLDLDEIEVAAPEDHGRAPTGFILVPDEVASN